MQNLTWEMRTTAQHTQNCTYLNLMLTNKSIEGNLYILDVLADSLVDNELEFPFKCKVGVPSMEECSPMKPDLQFSNTITEKRLDFTTEWRKHHMHWYLS